MKDIFLEGHSFGNGAPQKTAKRKPRQPSSRAVKPGTWAKIPHDRGLQLAEQAKDPMLAVLLVLEHAIHRAGSNQVRLTNHLLRQYKIPRQSKARNLRRLAAAGVITVEQHGKEAPVVTHHWYTKRGKLRRA